ncbi:MAG: DUF2654 domain-containing protein [Culicoidibacterales bacterium]
MTKIVSHRKMKKRMHVHRHEIKRLEALAEKALIENLPESYKYCISVLREIAMKPQLPAAEMEIMWKTSKTRMDELIVEAYNAVVAQ